ncbi:MAG: hypothetical protein MK160_11510 [Rhodobacteraceae bacterium]|nr:hypothetical protein [Paracoccaceae bacterium]
MKEPRKRYGYGLRDIPVYGRILYEIPMGSLAGIFVGCVAYFTGSFWVSLVTCWFWISVLWNEGTYGFGSWSDRLERWVKSGATASIVTGMATMQLLVAISLEGSVG